MTATFPVVTTSGDGNAAADFVTAAQQAGVTVAGLNAISQLQLVVANLLQALPSGIALTVASLTTTGAEKGVNVTFTPNAGIGVTRTGTANTTDECYLAFFAKDADGNPRKEMSVSSKWADTNATTGYSVMRLNADYLVAGVTTDDIQLRLFGGHGLAVFGPGDSTFPGDKAMGVYGTVRMLAAVVTPDPFAQTQGSYFASTVSGATLMGYGTTGDVTLKNRAGTDVLVVTANTVNVTLAGALQIAGALVLPLGSGTGLVSVGSADSGGTGFKLLRVPN